ncbi:MAG: zinc ribbon domain-containing protein [Dehalococcoidia bacterium]
MKNSAESRKMGCLCPYCEGEVALDSPLFCQLCRAELRYCLKCRIVVEKDSKVCPQCGQTLE